MLTFWRFVRSSRVMVFSPGSFRAARALLGRTQEQIANGSGVERRVVIRLETATFARLTDAGDRVRDFFESEGLKFLGEKEAPDHVGVRWRDPQKGDSKTRTQLRRQLHAGRVLVGLSQPELAERAEVGRTALTRFENGITVYPTISLIDAVKTALKAEGIEFLSDSDQEGFGVFLKETNSG